MFPRPGRPPPGPRLLPPEAFGSRHVTVWLDGVTHQVRERASVSRFERIQFHRACPVAFLKPCFACIALLDRDARQLIGDYLIACEGKRGELMSAPGV